MSPTQVSTLHWHSSGLRPARVVSLGTMVPWKRVVIYVEVEANRHSVTRVGEALGMPKRLRWSTSHCNCSCEPFCWRNGCKRMHAAAVELCTCGYIVKVWDCECRWPLKSLICSMPQVQLTAEIFNLLDASISLEIGMKPDRKISCRPVPFSSPARFHICGSRFRSCR
jgi:hypothetical protein